MNKIIQKAIELHEGYVGDLGCIGDYSCECFKCQLQDFSLDIERHEEGIINNFETDVLQVRDRLSLIVSGMIDRERCVGGQVPYGAKPGKRKLMLKDAKSIAEQSVGAINRAIVEFDKARK